MVEIRLEPFLILAILWIYAVFPAKKVLQCSEHFQGFAELFFLVQGVYQEGWGWSDLNLVKVQAFIQLRLAIALSSLLLVLNLPLLPFDQV